MRDFARLAFFFASPRHFDFLDYEIETSMGFECERETFRLLNCEPHIWLRAMRMSLYNWKSHKGSLCCKPLYETSDLKICQQSINSIFFSWPWPYYPVRRLHLVIFLWNFWLTRCHLQLKLSGSRQKECACLNSVEVEAFKTMEETEMGIRPSSSHRKRKHESCKYSVNVGIYECADNSLLEKRINFENKRLCS